MSIRKIFTLRLREAIVKASCSQRKLADKLGIHVNTIQRWLNGENWPSPEMLEQICVILRVEPSWLIGGEKDSAIELTKARIISSVYQMDDEASLEEIHQFIKRYPSEI